MHQIGLGQISLFTLEWPLASRVTITANNKHTKKKMHRNKKKTTRHRTTFGILQNKINIEYFIIIIITKNCDNVVYEEKIILWYNNYYNYYNY